MSMRPAIASLGALLCLAAAGGARAAPGSAPRGEVAIREVLLSDGARRYTIPVQVGAATIEAGLDTGSTGLRVLPGALGPADADKAGGGDTYSYGSGAELRGVVGKGQLTIGGLSAPTTLQLVRTVGCISAIPKCPASRIPQDQYGVQGDGLPGEGFKAIIGVNMAEAEVASPLSAIGARRWIVELPRPGETAPGRLVLNPTDDEIQGYAMLPIVAAFHARQGGLHDSVSGCILNDATGKKACGPLMMDSGAPGIAVVNSGLGGQPWAQGPATLAFYDGGGKARAMEAFTIGARAQASKLSFENRAVPTVTAIFSGLTPYFAFSVLYDPEHGMVGLKPRAPAPGGPTGVLAP